MLNFLFGMKYITYLRVSTEKQGKSGLGVEAQRSAVSAFVRNNKIIAEFVEIESGKKNIRPELLKAIELTKLEKATLLIAKLDRLSRNAAFIFSLRDSGVKFVCADMPDANFMTIGIFATLAQAERELISERTKNALKIKSLSGVKLGTPTNLTDSARKKGAQANRDKAENNPTNQRARSYASLLRSSGSSFSDIAAKLNDNGYRTPGGNFWVKGSVYRLLGRNF